MNSVHPLKEGLRIKDPRPFPAEKSVRVIFGRTDCCLIKNASVSVPDPVFVVCIRPGLNQETVLHGVIQGGQIVICGIGRIDALDPINILRKKMDLRDIIPVPERMCLNHGSARLVDQADHLSACPVRDLRMREQKLPADPVKQVFISVEILLNPEKDLEPYGIAGLLSLLISLHVGVHIIRPGKISGRTGIPMKEMIGDKDAVITPVPENRRIFSAGRSAAGTGFHCMKMGLVAVHEFLLIIRKAPGLSAPFVNQQSLPD